MSEMCYHPVAIVQLPGSAWEVKGSFLLLCTCYCFECLHV